MSLCYKKEAITFLSQQQNEGFLPAATNPTERGFSLPAATPKMNHLLRKNRFQLSKFVSYSPAPYSIQRQKSHVVSSSPAPYPIRLQESHVGQELPRVYVWWDLDNCNLPPDVDVSKVASSITNAVRANGIEGTVDITAFGNVYRHNLKGLIDFKHFSKGGKNCADISRLPRLLDLMNWFSQSPPPAHLFLISGDRDFAVVLQRLRMLNYNILLAAFGKAPDVLCYAATIVWEWTSLLKGEDLTGKHFNHPPDGQIGSWYGDSKVPLENPFSEESTSSQNPLGGVPKPSSDLKVGGGLRSMKFSDDEIVRSADASPKVLEKCTTLGKLSAGTDHTMRVNNDLVNCESGKYIAKNKHEDSKLPGSFWNDMESFVFSPKGSLLISQSRSREDLAHKLQKHGPMTLKSFAANDIFQLVELLIAGKKWLEESPSQAFPFRLIQSVWKITTKYTKKSRNDILQDFQKLVYDVLREHPEGYNIGCFRIQSFDIKKLGYQKMAIKIIPVSDYDSSEPEGDNSCSTQLEDKVKPKFDEQVKKTEDEPKPKMHK